MDEALKSKLIGCAPETWLDSLLTGPDAVLKGHGPWGCPDIEALCNAIRARIQAVCDENKSWTSWIAVGERLPEGGRQVLARNSAGYMACVTTIYLNEMDGRFDGEDETPEDTTEPIGDITHWMPLPEPPKPGDVLPDGALVTMPDGERMYALGPCGDDDTDDDEPLPTGGERG